MASQQPSFFHFRYRLENAIISRGTIPLMLQATIAFVLFSLIVACFFPASMFVVSHTRLTWGQFMLSGIFPKLADVHFPPRIWALVLWLFSGVWAIVAVGYISLATASIYLWLSDVQRGRKPVRAREHTVILGWSLKGVELVQQLLHWNPNTHKARVAILANVDAMQLQQELVEKLPYDKQQRLMVRSGSALVADDLRLVNIAEAKTVIILPEEQERDADIAILKILLALMNAPFQRHMATHYHVVAAMHHPSNGKVAEMIAGNRITVLHTFDIVSRLIAQTCRQPGLSEVYAELMTFRGAEIYFQREPLLWGKTFREAVFSYADSTVIGIRKSKKNMISLNDPEPFLRTKERDIVINPSEDYTLEEGDALIVISTDSRSVVFGKQRSDAVKATLIAENAVPLQNPEKILLVGWSPNAPSILKEIDAYAVRGSKVVVMRAEGENLEKTTHPPRGLKNLEITYWEADSTDREAFGVIKPNEFDHVIVLSDIEQYGIEEADSRSLISLVHLRDIAIERKATYNLVSEMANARNQSLAQLAKPDDFIVGDNLISLLLAQVAENRELKMVFEEFLDASGCEINLRPAEEYVLLEESVNFYTITEAALRKKQIAIGVRFAAHSKEEDQNFGIVLNPPKEDEIIFRSGDRIIVIIE